MAVFSVADQFANYYEYHQNKINQIIHFIFVPVLLFSALMFLSLVNVPIIATSSVSLNQLVNNLGFVLALPLALYYLLLDRAAGLVLTAQISLMIYTSIYLKYNVSRAEFYFIAAMAQIVGWGTQFFGHGVFEGRRPALVDNIFQTLIAPLFVVIEAFFFLGLKSDLKKQVEKIMVVKREKLAKRNK
jgi:uncharacterized membrane protein YGL010W